MFLTATALDVLILTGKEERIITEFGSLKKSVIFSISRVIAR